MPAKQGQLEKYDGLARTPSTALNVSIRHYTASVPRDPAAIEKTYRVSTESGYDT